MLGELIVGILAGNVALFGGPDLSALASSETLTVMAELGAVLLLFHVGLESTPEEMMAVGGRAALVAVGRRRHAHAARVRSRRADAPRESWMFHAFLGAMLAATSVGITARVLKDADALRAPFARIILGAAVIDDVLGLVVLAVVSGIITAAATGDGAVRRFRGLDRGQGARRSWSERSWSARSSRRACSAARSRFGAAVWSSRSRSASASCSPTLPCARVWRRSSVPSPQAWSWRTCTSRATCSEASRPFTRAWSRSRLCWSRCSSSAWACSWTCGPSRRRRSWDSRPCSRLAAILGKLACGAVAPKGVSGLTLGLGMMPRGEVGLIFAGIGAQLVLAGRPVVDAGTYAAAVFMVVATTMLTPPLLLWSIRRV